MKSDLEVFIADLVCRWLDTAGFHAEAATVATAYTANTDYAKDFLAATSACDFQTALRLTSSAFPHHTETISDALIAVAVSHYWTSDPATAGNNVIQFLQNSVSAGLITSAQAAAAASAAFVPPAPASSASDGAHERLLSLVARLAVAVPETTDAPVPFTQTLSALVAAARARPALAPCQPLPARETATGFGHTAAVRALSWFIMDERHFVVSGGRDSSLRLWEVTTGVTTGAGAGAGAAGAAAGGLSPVAEVGAVGRIWDITTTPTHNGTLVYVALSVGQLGCYHVASGGAKPSLSLLWNIQLPENGGRADNFSVTPIVGGGRGVAVGDARGRVAVVNEGGIVLRVKSVSSSPVHGLSSGRAGSVVAAVGDGNTLIIDTDTLTVLHSSSCYAAPLHAVTTSHDGARCATVASDGRLRVLSTAPRPTPPGARSPPLSLPQVHHQRAAFRPLGRFVAVPTAAAGVAIVDADTGAVESTLKSGSDAALLAVAWVGRSRLVVGGCDGVLRLFEP